MRKYEKEILQICFNDEVATLKQIEDIYKSALNLINQRIKMLRGGDEDLQSKIYQLRYQQALKAQLETILERMGEKQYKTIEEYLEDCYEKGFTTALYSMQQQGVPLAFPLGQAAAVQAIQLDSKISEGLYKRLGVDTQKLKKTIASEITRGIAASMPYRDIARNVDNIAKTGYSNAVRIARTEGHRIQQAATMDAQRKAKAVGASVVKEWNAALDGKTRPEHRKIDGEIKDIEEKYSNGLMFPGDPSGRASEVINCRCASLTRAKWALDSEQTSRLGNTEDMTDADLQPIANKLNIPVSELRKYSGQIIPIKAKNYADFRRQYNKVWNYENQGLK